MHKLFNQITLAASSLLRPAPSPYKWIKRIRAAEFVSQLEAQALPNEQLTFKCPRCACLYNANDLIAAGVGPNLREVGQYLGVSCITRFIGHERSRSKLSHPCTWKLGGLLPFHRLEVVHRGATYPFFEIATPDEARSHLAETGAVALPPPKLRLRDRDLSGLPFRHLL